MAKIIYNIRSKKDGNIIIEKLSGYTFNVSGLKFGVSNELPNGGKSEVWRVTELSSGCICADADTKKMAIHKVMDSAFLEKIRIYLDNNKWEDINKNIQVNIIYRTKV